MLQQFICSSRRKYDIPTEAGNMYTRNTTKQSTYTLLTSLYTYFFTDSRPLCQQSRPCKQGGLIMSLLLSLLSSPSRQAIVLLPQSKAKQSLPAQRSPSLGLNHLATYSVPFAHLACICLFSRDVKTPRDPMTWHQLGILRQHSSRAYVHSQPWAES
jgi:hypothetical protein